ncbi:MAG: EF-Tu/IF-2/RF-3 family GTPase, partial [Deinococcales bacterium]
MAQEYRDRLVESIVETDDELMMQYLEDNALDPEALMRAFDAAVRGGELTPVLLTSATRVMGVSLLMDFMNHGVRHVQDHKPLAVDEGDPPELGEDRPFGARVFKTVVDPYLGKVSMMRVLSGRVKAGDNVKDANHDVDVRISHLYVPEGKDLKEVKELTAGMIGAVTKVEEIRTGDTLCDPAHAFQLSAIRFPSPVMALALTPRSRGDEDKMSDGLHKLLDADPTLLLERNADTHETVLWGMGHVHLEIAVNALKERFGVDVDTRPPAVAYRETISGNGDARYRHKKQTGGAGQFAEVALRVAPLARGAGFEFAWKVVGGSIPSGFQPSCEKGVRSALEAGVLGGFPVQDVKVEVYDGKDHPVDSKDIAFQIA